MRIYKENMKKNIKPVFSLIHMLVVSGLIAGCGGGESTPEVAKPTLNEVKVSGSMTDLDEVERLRYFKEINADKARKEYKLTGKGINITIMGEIVDASHPEIKNRVKKQFNTYSKKGQVLSGKGNQPYKFELFGKDHGHGTHIAGTIAAECDGIGIQGVACDSTIDVYDIGAYGNEAIPLEGWGDAGGIEQILFAFSTALKDVAKRKSSRILTGSFNIESPAILFKAGGSVENQSITQIEKRFEQTIKKAKDLSEKGFVSFQNAADIVYLDRVFTSNGSDPLTLLGILLPKSKEWQDLENAIKTYQSTDGVYIITESNNLFENRTSVLNAMPSLSDKVSADLWISAVLATPKGLNELLGDPTATTAQLEALIEKREYITPINSCGEMAKDYCILIPSYEVFSTMTRAVASDGNIFLLDKRTYQTQSGHSMGAPMIAAALALMQEKNTQNDQGYTMKDLVRILKQSADKSFPGYDQNKHGQGMLDISAALKKMDN
jgi:hypothetical protein